jgi:DNA-binding IclR family transcriptional regulator
MRRFHPAESIGPAALLRRPAGAARRRPRNRRMTDPLPPAGRRRHHEQPTLNRSLERGVEILRAFRPGADLLGNGEIAERTGLSRATVSRLTRTLVETGLLEHDLPQRAYRLAAPLLSFAHAMRAGSPVLGRVAPLMRLHAERLRINVGLAVADRDEMVYLESVRYHRKVSLRNVVAGQRVPIAPTSLGRAYLAVLPEPARSALMAQLQARRPNDWDRLRGEIDRARDDVAAQGWCAAAWQPEVVAIAAPLVIAPHPVHALNLSLTSARPLDEVRREWAPRLLEIAAEVRSAVARMDPDRPLPPPSGSGLLR